MKITTRFTITILLFTQLLWADVFINQGGYLPAAPKFVFSDQAADSFYVKSAINHNILYRGQMALGWTNDAATGMTLYRGDFSAFEDVGAYYIEVDGNSSFIFGINENVCQDVYARALKSFYYQRCGVDLTGPSAGIYFRTRGHIADGFYHPSTGQSGFHPAQRGWYDAGDYGKYIVNAGITVGTMLMGYEEFPQMFADDDLNIPESNNGIPDILDEIRFELEWMLKMQNNGGGVHHKLTRENFTGYFMPANDNSGARYIYEISSTATADFAAVMARASRIFQAFDTTFAQSCLAASELAWDFLEANPTIVPPGGFSNPSGTHTGVYGDGNDRDERLWAAIELFETTGDVDYHNYYTQNYQQVGLITAEMSWPNVRTMAHLTYLRGEQTGLSGALKNILRTSLTSFCQSLLGVRQSNGFYVALSPGEYRWGSNSTVLNRAIMLIFGYEEVGNTLYLDAAYDQLSYILGANAHRLSFVTGVGSNYPMHIHHRISEADGIVEPIPGLVAGGPNEYLQDPVLQATFNASTPPALCYIDDLGSYGSNEIAINWSATLVFVSGYFSKNSPLTSLPPRQGALPQNFRLEQNYPNPFNGETIIPFSVADAEPVRLKIYDTLGKLVYGKDYGILSPGSYQLNWEGRNNEGHDAGSGVYYYQLSSGTNQLTRQMLYVK